MVFNSWIYSGEILPRVEICSLKIVIFYSLVFDVVYKVIPVFVFGIHRVPDNLVSVRLVSIKSMKIKIKPC